MPPPPSPRCPSPSRRAAPDVALGFLLADVLRLTRSEFRRQAQGLRLTPALSRLLFYVDQKPGCSQAELASYIDVTTATVGRMIDRLESAGFVRRRPDPADRRTFRIHLDRAAAPLLQRMHAALERTTLLALRGIVVEDEATLRRVLERMRANMTITGH